MKIVSDKKQIAVLIDPDKTDSNQLQKTIEAANKAGVDFFLVGGSLVA
jgi:heptaprenylglyceryl phosphate synthase